MTYEEYRETLVTGDYPWFVARKLRQGESCVIGYAPQNGTNYTLVFTPVVVHPDLLVELPTDRPGGEAVISNFGFPEGMTGISKSMIQEGSTWAYVSWMNHGCYLFRLGGFAHWSYIAEKFDIRESTIGDAFALAALFEDIAKELVRDEVQAS